MNQATMKLSEDESSPSMSSNTANAKNFSRTPTSWDALDDILLMHLKDQQKLGWKEIASNFTNRTPNACQFRWRRLKSGNLKNPPKSSSGLGSPASGSKVPATSGLKKSKKGPGNARSVSPSNDSPSAFSSYSPITTATFTGYDNNINNALAGLNALSNTPSNISSPMPNYHIGTNTNSSTPGLNSPDGGHRSHSLGHNHFDNSPRSEVSLDPQSHHGTTTNSGGGYYADISIDPTMNLPHNQAHPHTPGHLTPRNSTSQGSQANSNRSNHQTHPIPHNVHNNSIIQIVKDDRTSVSSATRASVSSLPSKSMNIPHHQLNNSALAHLPILFGGGSSISGPSRNASVSGIPSTYQSTTVSSIRNGSVGSLGYYSRSGSVVIPFTGDKRDDENLKPDLKKADFPANTKKTPNKTHNSQKNTSKSSTPNAQATIFKIPWSMEEDELLINRRNRELSFAELSILLPQRTEGEIWSRIDYLEKLRNGHRSSTSREHRRGRQSSIGLDDDDDFYDEVDDVIDGIDVSEDDDEDDDVLVDDDESLHHGTRKRKKRRTSSAVNPLAVGETLRRKLK